MTSLARYFFASTMLVLTIQSVRAEQALANLGSYSQNINVLRLQQYIVAKEDNADRLKKTALLAGYAILYDFAMKNGGAQKFYNFSDDCYRIAFASGEMRYILNCYIAINVVVDQIERTAKVDIKGKFDEILYYDLKQQGITDPKLLKNITSQFDDALNVERRWIENLTVEQVMKCVDHGIGKSCRY